MGAAPGLWLGDGLRGSFKVTRPFLWENPWKCTALSPCVPNRNPYFSKSLGTKMQADLDNLKEPLKGWATFCDWGDPWKCDTTVIQLTSPELGLIATFCRVSSGPPRGSPVTKALGPGCNPFWGYPICHLHPVVPSASTDATIVGSQGKRS